jgi:hypothetical protein
MTWRECVSVLVSGGYGVSNHRTIEGHSCITDPRGGHQTSLGPIESCCHPFREGSRTTISRSRKTHLGLLALPRAFPLCRFV